MNSDLDRWVKTAVDCFETDGSLQNENISKFQKLLQLIVEEWDLDNSQFSASDDVISRKVRSILLAARNESDPVRYFHNSKGDVQRELGTTPLTTYTITFPLNISFSNWDNAPNELVIRETSIERVGLSKWKKQYWSLLKDKRKIERFLRKSPNKTPSRELTYWRCRIDAIDQHYAVNRATKLIQLLCAKINFAINYHRVPGIQESAGPWPYRWSELREPFVYFVFRDGLNHGFYANEIYNSYFYSSDPTPRDKVRVNNFYVSRTQDILDLLPQFSSDLGEIEEYLIDGFARYQSGLTEPNREQAFLNYWRAIENMTLTDETERMTAIPKRASSLFKPDDPDTFEYRLERVRLIRNKVVHESEETDIEKEDLVLLKNVLEELIFLFIEFKDRWDIDDFRFILNEGSNDASELDELKAERHREIYLIQQFLKGR